MKTSTRFTKEQREEIVQRWQASGKSKKVFTDEHGIKYVTFMKWLGKGQKKEPLEIPSQQFIPLQLPLSTCFAELTYEGKKITFHQPVSASYLKIILR
jgi:hypothetical protein